MVTRARERVPLEASDKELIRLAGQGDQQAFDVLMQRHEKALIRWVWSLVGNEEEAQDVAQDAFLQAYIHAKKFNPRFGFKTWLYTIARNRAISLLRKRSRCVAEIGTPARGEERNADEPEDSWVSLAEDGSPDARQLLTAKEEAEWLMLALDRLDEAHAEVLRLKYFGGMKSQEIADIMGLEVGTVWSRVHHGLKKLRSLAEEVGYGR